jgi:hypothetical protein
MESVDYPLMKFWLDLVQTLAIIVIALWELVAARQRATKAAINRVDEKVDKLEDRVLVVEQRMPTSDRWDQIYTRLGSVEQKMSSLDAKLEATDRLLDILHRFNLDKDRMT